jgi:hypothetical protein
MESQHPGRTRTLQRYSFRVAPETPETPAETIAGNQADLIIRMICHLDEQLHEIRQFLDDARPLLAAGQRFARNPVADYLAARTRMPTLPKGNRRDRRSRDPAGPAAG